MPSRGAPWRPKVMSAFLFLVAPARSLASAAEEIVTHDLPGHDSHARAADLLEAMGQRAASLAPGATTEHA